MAYAARVTDHHSCPLALPTAHVGGLITGPGVEEVLIGHAPAATQGTSCVCPPGPKNAIVEGSLTVLIGMKGAARVGDATAHGGLVISGCRTVLIGG